MCLKTFSQNSASENKPQTSKCKTLFFLPLCILIGAFCGVPYSDASPTTTQSQPAHSLALLKSIPDNPIAAYVSYTNTGLNPATGQVLTSLLTTASLAGLFNANQQILVDIVSSLVAIGKFPHAVFLLEARCKKLGEGSFSLAGLTLGTVVHAPPDEHGKLLALLKQTIDHYFTADDARIAWVGAGPLRRQKLDSPKFPNWCCWEWGSVGPVFVFTVGPGAYDTVVNTILEKHPALFDNSLIQISKDVDTDFDYRFMTVYLNLTALSRNLRPVMKDSLDPVIESFGAVGIDQFLYSAGFAKKAYLSKTFTARGEKVSIGYLTADFPPGDPRARAVPPRAGSYGVGFTDLSKAVSYLTDTYLASRNPIRREKLIANYQTFSAEAGLGNLKEFLLAHFGPAAMVIVHDWPKHPFNLPIGKTLIIQHDRSPDFLPTTHKILATWQRMLRAMGETGKKEKFTSAWETLFDLQLDQTPDGVWFLHLGPFVFLAAGLDDNFLVLSYSVPAVQLNLQHLKATFRPTTTQSTPGP
jgi:hypothetical protein